MTFFCLYVLFCFALPFLFCLHVFVVLAKKIVVFVILFLNVFLLIIFLYFIIFIFFVFVLIVVFSLFFKCRPVEEAHTNDYRMIANVTNFDLSHHSHFKFLSQAFYLICECHQFWSLSSLSLQVLVTTKQASKKVIVVASKAKQVDSQESCTTQMHSLHHGLLKIEISRQFIFLKSPEIFSESIVKLFKNK